MILLMMPRVRASTAISCSGESVSETAAHAVELGLAQGFQVLLQADDGGDDLGGLGALLEAAHLFFHQRLGAHGFLAAVADVRGHDLLQIVDVIDEDSIEVVKAGIDVARHRNVNEEHGAVFARVEKLFAVLLLEDGVGRAGGADDDIGPGHGLIEAVEGDGFAVELCGQGRGAVEGAVADEDLFGSVGDQMAGGQFAHLAGSDEVHRLAVQTAEDLLRQFDGDRCDGDRRSGDGGLIADLFGYGKGAGEELIELRVDRAEGARGGVGFLDLTENLRLADHHGIQAGGDAEDVLDGLQALVLEDVGLVLAAAEAEVLAHEALQIAMAVLGAGEDLHPVAGGDDHGLLDAFHGGELGESLGQARLGNGKALPHLDRRRFVIHTQYRKIHGATNLCNLLM